MLERVKQFFSIPLAMTRRAMSEFDLKRAFDRQRVGLTLDPFPTANTAKLFQWSRESGIAYACISKIAESSQDPDLIIQRRKDRQSEWVTDYGHPLRQLLMRPNPGVPGLPPMTQADFLSLWLASEQICGVFFAEIERAGQSGRPVAIWPLDPTLMAVDYKTGLWEWRYQGERIDFDGNKDLFISFLPDPQRPWCPLAPLQVALGEVVADAMQSMYVRAFFKNGGVPSGIIKIKGRTLSDEQATEKRRRWMRRFGLGGESSQGPVILDDNADYEKVGSNLNEIAGETVRAQSEARICGVFGVPPLLISAYVGLVNVNQRASAAEGMKDFWFNKMSPTFKRLRTHLQWSLLTEFEDERAIMKEDIRVFWDMSNVVALQEDITQRDQRARESFRAGALTLNEYRAIMSLPPAPNGDYYLRRANQIPASNEVVDSMMAAAADAAARAVTLSILGSSDPSALAEDDDEKRARNRHTLKTENLKLKTVPYDWEGVACCRAPTEWERKIRLVETGKAMIAGASVCLSVLESAHKSLIADAVLRLGQSDPAHFHELILSFPPAEALKLRDEIGSLFSRGVGMMQEEVALGRERVGSISLSVDAPSGELDLLASVTVSRVLNDVQARAVSLAAHLYMLIEDDRAWIEQVEERLREQSLQFIAKAAREAANVSISMGRHAAGVLIDDAGVKSEDEDTGWMWTYMAIFDENTCNGFRGSCEDLDLQQITVKTKAQIERIAPVPNPNCGHGYGECRCTHEQIPG